MGSSKFSPQSMRTSGVFFRRFIIARRWPQLGSILPLFKTIILYRSKEESFEDYTIRHRHLPRTNWSVWHEDEFPFAESISSDLEHLASLQVPDPRHHGMAPFVLERLLRCREPIESAGHSIKFAVARGPLNIAGFLAGNTELMMGMKILLEITC